MSDYIISPADFWTIVIAFSIASSIVTHHITKRRIEHRHSQDIQRANKRATFLQ